MAESVRELVEILLTCKNDAWRDDAAQELARVPDWAEAEAALLAAIESPMIDDSLRRTCAESLATIWIDRGEVPLDKLNRLTGMPREVVDAYLRAVGIAVSRPENSAAPRTGD